MERNICRPVILFLLLQIFTAQSFAQSFIPDSFHFKRWKYRSFSEDSFFKKASQGASGVFINSIHKEPSQVLLFSGKLPPKTTWSKEDWRAQVYVPQKTPVTYLNERFSNQYYTGQMNYQKNAQTVRVLVLSFRDGDHYTLLIATNNTPKSLPQDSEILELYNSILKKQLFR